MKRSGYNRFALYTGLLLATIGAMLYLKKLRGYASEETIHPRDWAEIKAEGKLVILSAYNALDYRVNQEEMTGRVYDLAGYLGKCSGLDVEVRLENNRDVALQALLKGEVDLIASPFVLNSTLDTTALSWVNLHLSEPIYLVQKRDSASTISSQLELAGKTITLPKGSELSLMVRHLSEEIGDSIFVEENPTYDTEQIVVQVANSRADYTLVSWREAQYYSKAFAQIDASLPISYNLRRVWLTRKASPELKDSLDHWLANRPNGVGKH